MVGGDGEPTGTDLTEATNYALYVVGGDPEEASYYLGWLIARTRNIFKDRLHQAAVRELANALLEKKQLGYRKARKIIKEAIKTEISRLIKPVKL